MMTEEDIFLAKVSENLVGMRLDQAMVLLFPSYSRSCLQNWIKAGHVTVNGSYVRPRHPVHFDATIELHVPIVTSSNCEPEILPIDVVFEDDTLLVINKPAGLVVHPGAGNFNGTLQNGLLYRWPTLHAVPRAGLVHRLDKDTTGLLIVAKTLSSHNALICQMQERKIEREYQAVVNGVITTGGCIDAPLGRHPVDRKRIAVRPNGRRAVTHFRVLERFRAHTLVKVRLETGRTHQIRVHMTHKSYPLVGDRVYCGRSKLPKKCSPALLANLQDFKRQALHAERLCLTHPETGEVVSWTAPLPIDINDLLANLRNDLRLSHEQ